MTIRHSIHGPRMMFAPEGALAGAAGAASATGNNAGVGAGGVPTQNNSGAGQSPGGATGAGAAPASPSAGGDGGQAQGQQGSPGPYRPDGLPDHFAGKDDKETIDKLHTAVKGFRQQQGDKGAVPDKPDGYQLQVDPNDATLKPFVDNLAKDPVFATTREIFHKAGITDKQFNQVVGPWMKALVEGGHVPAPVDGVAELMKLVPAEAGTLDDAGKKAAAGRRLQDNIAWADGMGKQGTMPAAVAEWLAAQAADSVQANLAIEWLRGRSREPRPALDGQGGGGGGMTRDSVAARMVDPRNDPRSPKFEKAFADETDRQNRIVNA